MRTAVAFSTTGITGAIGRNNMRLAVNDSVVVYPTSSTGFYNSIAPGASGYTIYINKASGGPAVYVPANDADLVSITSKIGASGLTNAAGALAYLATQSGMICVNRVYEEIVTTGLVSILDPGFVASYPKGGTSMYDFSGTANNVTLVNGPTFNSADGGIIVFDGADDRAVTVSTLNLSTTPTITISMWVKFLSLPTGGGDSIRMLLELSDNYNTVSDSFWTGVVLESGNNRWFTQDKGNVGYNAKNLTTPLPVINTWYNFTVVYDHTQTASNQRTFYINGANETNIASTEGGTTYNSANTNNFGNRTLYIGGRSGGSFSSNMNLGVLQIYSRALSASEALQNYNAQKSRFGL